MRILWITSFPPRRCGIGDYSADLTTHLARDARVAVRVLTYADGLAPGVTRWDGIEVSRNLDARASPHRIAREIEAFGPDLVHLQSSSFLHRPSVNRALRRACDVPLVTTVHDTPRSWRVFYTIPSLRGIYRKSHRLIVHSSAVTRVLQDFHGVDGQKIARMPHGVDTSVYRPDADTNEARREYGLGEARVVLFFGFLRPGKGLETLLRAWAHVAPTASDAVLVVAGGSPTQARRYGLIGQEAEYPETLRKMAADLDVLDRVCFTDYVPDSLVPGLLASAEVAVLPYGGSPSQSGPLHKLLSAGRPIIATAFPGFQEVLTQGSEALLVPAGDAGLLAEAIQRLLRDPATAREMGKRARQTAEQSLDWSIVARQTLDLYEGVHK